MEELLKRIEEQLKRTKESEDYGCYNCAAYFLSSVPSTAILAANPYRAFDNIEALASGESSAYRCYGIGDVDCHGDKVDKMYSGYSLK